jgi:hypothetical protein
VHTVALKVGNHWFRHIVIPKERSFHTLRLMGASEDMEAEVQQAEQAVTKQGDTVRSLKALLKEGKGQKVSTLRRS